MTAGAGLAAAIFLLLLLGGFWIPFAVAVGALLMLWDHGGWGAFRAIGFVSWGSLNSFTLTAIPLFLLMAEILLRSGVGARAYRGLGRVTGRLPGGLLQTNIAGCALFAAINGSSVATAATIGTVALPEMRARGYDPRMAAGSLAAGGTLGILIPPSIAMIVYATFTETSVSRLFAAGIIPGLAMTGLFMAFIAWRAIRHPGTAPRAVPDGKGLGAMLSDLLPFVLLIGLVLGSIYGGVATPTEAAAVGVLGAFVLAACFGRCDAAVIGDSLAATVRTTASVLFIVLAAALLSYALGVTGIGREVAQAIVGLGLPKLAFLLAVVVLYVIMGCFIDSLAMIVITVPLLHPVLQSYGVDAVWFGVLLVILIEMGQITPPFGINLFVIQGIGGGSFEEVAGGSLPYVALMGVMILLLIAFPALALWLPGIL
jgi:tripartite ATP-independent transporter DctM subunit